MHISQVQLENIKSHVSSTYEFTRGTTAITGENGAGKTTIIEAIAWALFDLLEYKKEDFVRRGAKKGTVTVTFESGLDQREYVVHRDTGTGYHITDPRLQTRVADKKEEVFRFLWQHLGLEPGTDLRSLFRQAIGVPQGTFTAIFLEGAAERKAAFDRLLKVEEYRQAAEKLRDTARYLESKITSVRENIARAEGELSRAETVEQDHAVQMERSALLTDQLELNTAELTKKQQLVKTLDETERRTAGLRTAFERSVSQREKAELVLKQSQDAVERSATAAEKCSASEAQYRRHIEVLGRLREMERERQQRDKLRSQLAEVEGAIVHVYASKKQLEQEMDALQKAHAEIDSLRPNVGEQEMLEKQIEGLRESAAAVRSLNERIAAAERRRADLRAAYKKDVERLREFETKSAAAAELDPLQQRDAELTRSIAALTASLERDRKFQAEIKDGFCPVLSERCLNLKEGQTLEAFVTTQFTELRMQIDTAEQEHRSVAEGLKRAREAAAHAAALAELKTHLTQLEADGKSVKEEIDGLTARRAKMTGADESLMTAEAGLRELGDPRGRIKLLETVTAREMELRQGRSEIEANIERLESERRLLVEEMESYRDLDAKWTGLSDEREATSAGHRTYLSSEAEAKALDDRQKGHASARDELARSIHLEEEAQKSLKDAESNYDPAVHQSERELFREIEKQNVRIRSELSSATKRADELAAELARFTDVRRSMRDEFREKERLERVAETTAFIRDTLKEAAPRVARNYVYHVSIEAAQMFREITGNAEYTLKWAEDYSIVMEENGYERPFASLSGGEQMAAALSVRLALLKQLTDIRVAFFDEPTANMDAERRENLAVQISRITHFDQLFVISHDETFDNFVDNVISIERQAA